MSVGPAACKNYYAIIVMMRDTQAQPKEASSVLCLAGLTCILVAKLMVSHCKYMASVYLDLNITFD